jgi:hypothetical protein
MRGNTTHTSKDVSRFNLQSIHEMRQEFREPLLIIFAVAVD